MTGMNNAEAAPAVAIGCSIVDVFAERPLSGNQLAVVRGCSHLDTATMQAIALETNFSETTFVVEEFTDEARRSNLHARPASFRLPDIRRSARHGCWAVTGIRTLWISRPDAYG